MIRLNFEYHQTRAREEIDRARSAASACARRAHLELAQLHLDRLRDGSDHFATIRSGVDPGERANEPMHLRIDLKA